MSNIAQRRAKDNTNAKMAEMIKELNKPEIEINKETKTIRVVPNKDDSDDKDDDFIETSSDFKIDKQLEQ